MSYNAATSSPLDENQDMASKDALDAISQHQVFRYFGELPEEMKALPHHWLFKIKHIGAVNVQLFKGWQVCEGNQQI
jgi:hypothetical protein